MYTRSICTHKRYSLVTLYCPSLSELTVKTNVFTYWHLFKHCGSCQDVLKPASWLSLPCPHQLNTIRTARQVTAESNGYHRKNWQPIHEEDSSWWSLLISVAWGVSAPSTGWPGPRQENKHKIRQTKHKMKPGLYTVDHKLLAFPDSLLDPMSVLTIQHLLFSVTITTLPLLPLTCLWSTPSEYKHLE